MYCHHCGNKLNDNDKFCGRCGSKVLKRSATSSNDTAAKQPSADSQSTEPVSRGTAEISDSSSAAENTRDINSSIIASENTTETIKSESANDHKESKSSSLKAAVTSNRKRSRRKMPLILVVALVLALASSVAYAAYYVYTEVVLPQMQASAMELKEVEGGEMIDESAPIPEVDEQPGNILQFPKIIALTPHQIDDYIYGEGLSIDENKQFAPDEVAASWISDEDYLLQYFDQKAANTNLFSNSLTEYKELDLSLYGETPNFLFHDWYPTMTIDELQSGIQPVMILASINNLVWLNNDTLRDFLNLTDLGLASAKVSTIWEEEALPGGSEDIQVFAGCITVNEEQYYWYLIQTRHQICASYYGCLNEESAQKAFSVMQISETEEWHDNNPHRNAFLLAQALCQQMQLTWEGDEHDESLLAATMPPNPTLSYKIER